MDAPAQPDLTALTVPELFAVQARRGPDAVAVVCRDAVVTYAELDAAANRVAGVLTRAGAGPESRVGVVMDRGTGLAAVLLGVLRAGAAYVPADPGAPAERLAWLLADAGAGLVVTDGDPGTLDGVRVVSAAEALAGPGGSPAPMKDSPDRLAYLMYTSGSTGVPKGVLVEHRSLANFCAYRRRVLELRPGDRMTALHSPAFDASTGEIWSALAAASASRPGSTRPGGAITTTFPASSGTHSS